MSFSAMLPVKPSITTTSADALRELRALDVADEVQAGAAAARELAREPRAAPASPWQAPRRWKQGDARRIDPHHRLREGRAHVGELDQVLGPTGDVGATSSSSTGGTPGIGSGSASAGR